jgi:hypothetical protein
MAAFENALIRQAAQNTLAKDFMALAKEPHAADQAIHQSFTFRFAPHGLSSVPTHGLLRSSRLSEPHPASNIMANAKTTSLIISRTP